jgi:hypothetical protein
MEGAVIGSMDTIIVITTITDIIIIKAVTEIITTLIGITATNKAIIRIMIMTGMTAEAVMITEMGMEMGMGEKVEESIIKTVIKEEIISTRKQKV